MEIEYLGHSSFLITGKEFSVVTDPFTNIGYTVKRVNADYCTVSHEHFDHNYINGVSANKIIRECSDKFRTVKCFHDSVGGKKRGENKIFIFTLDGITVCHMGDVGESVNRAVTDKIGKVDVLLIPVGGNYTIDAVEAKNYVEAIRPKIVIPMHYKTAESDLDVDGVEKFENLFENVKRVVGKINITREQLPEKTEILIIEKA